MLKHILRSRMTSILICFILIALPSVASSMNLPINKEMTVRLSTLSSQGQLQTVSDLVTKTDALGKITFNFPSIPSSTTTPFLHIQIIDGITILRQTIVPSPQPGANIDVGVSETTDLQARSILKAAALSGKLSPLHLLVSQTLLRTPTISTADAEAVAAAIDDGATAITNVLATDGLSSDQLHTFMNSLSNGLADTAAVFRKSVDDSVVFDQKVEAYRRGEAYAVLLQALIKAGADVGISLETICTAFTAAGEATEAAIESNPNINSIAKAAMRFGFVSGILNLSNYRMLKELAKSFNYVGVAAPTFEKLFNVFDLVLLNTTNRLKGTDGELLAYTLQNDLQALRVREFNALAIQDLMLLKMVMESYSVEIISDSANLMLALTARMAGVGEVMSGMTPQMLMGILGRSASTPPLVFKTIGATTTDFYVPALTPYELAAWSYVFQIPSFSYAPIPGLIDQLDTKPTTFPAYDRLLEPYKSLALLMTDLGMIESLRWQDQQVVEDYNNANPLTPPRWYSLASVHQILEKNRQRYAVVHQHISGVSPEAQDALIYLLRGNRATEF